MLVGSVGGGGGGGGGAPTTTALKNLVMELRKCCNHPYLFEGADLGECVGHVYIFRTALTMTKKTDKPVMPPLACITNDVRMTYAAHALICAACALNYTCIAR